jgi:hypothetical protein
MSEDLFSTVCLSVILPAPPPPGHQTAIVDPPVDPPLYCTAWRLPLFAKDATLGRTGGGGGGGGAATFLTLGLS